MLIFLYSDFSTFQYVILWFYHRPICGNFDTFLVFSHRYCYLFCSNNSASFRWLVKATWLCWETNFSTDFFSCADKVLSHKVLAIYLRHLWLNFWLRNTLRFGSQGQFYRLQCSCLFSGWSSKRFQLIFCTVRPFRAIFDITIFSCAGFLQVWVSSFRQEAWNV